MIDPGKDGIYRQIQKGERVPTSLVVRVRDEKMRVVGDDYVRSVQLPPNQDKLADLKRHRRDLEEEVRKIAAEEESLRCGSLIAVTGAAETLKAITYNASAEPILVTLLRDECAAYPEDQDVPALREWTTVR